MKKKCIEELHLLNLLNQPIQLYGRYTLLACLLAYLLTCIQLVHFECN